MPKRIGRPIPVVPAKGLHDGDVQRGRKTVLVPGGRTLAGAERKNVGPGTRVVDLVFAVGSIRPRMSAPTIRHC